MGSVKVLDCTLRDGGYCNRWTFGHKNILKIVQGLEQARIDVIECGFITNRVHYDKDVTKFSTFAEAAEVIKEKKKDTIYVCMINYGEYKIEDIPEYRDGSIDGIRVAFHKKDLTGALEFCEQIKSKGYKVFVQAMVSLNYTDEEFLKLIDRANKLEPFAFYIVDSFGMMKKKDLLRLFYMVEHNLKREIWIGFHSHNNLQLAYSNAQALVEIQSNRDLIIDSSIHGMGRGAGNLNTELFLEYLNDTIGSDYILRPILTIIDESISIFYKKEGWGYSLPNYLSAVYNVHPYYASFLSNKNTLTLEAMDEIFAKIELSKGVEFDQSYIEELYHEYLSDGSSKTSDIQEFKRQLSGKKLLLIGPGPSSVTEKDKITAFTEKYKNEVVIIAINFEHPSIDTDYIFISNMRRFRELPAVARKKCITTTNIQGRDIYLSVSYRALINNMDLVSDNAGLMAINLLRMLGVQEVYLAGIDGYLHEIDENYGVKEMSFVASNNVLDGMNEGMMKMLQEYNREIRIHFVTSSIFETLDLDLEKKQ